MAYNLRVTAPRRSGKRPPLEVPGLDRATAERLVREYGVVNTHIFMDVVDESGCCERLGANGFKVYGERSNF